jgi:RHS repeat-associated protein
VVYRGKYDLHYQMLYEWAAGDTALLNSHKFTGYERDWATNLDYAKARTYTRYRARFIQPDPLGIAAADLTNPQSLNRYGMWGMIRRTLWIRLDYCMCVSVALAEIADDHAGKLVGGQMMRGLSGEINSEQLRQALFGILCAN